MNKELIVMIASFTKEASDAVSRLEAENVTVKAENTLLKNKVASLETGLGQQKSASVDDVVASAESTGKLVDNLIQAGFLKEGSRVAATTAMSADPFEAVRFLEAMAVKSIEKKSLPSLGHSIPKEATDKTQSSGYVDRDNLASDKAFEDHFGVV